MNFLQEKEAKRAENVHAMETKAKHLLQTAQHHQMRATQLSNSNSKLSGALTAIARNEKRESRGLYKEANTLIAQGVEDSLDLHMFTIERALDVVYKTLHQIRSAFKDFIALF